MLESTLCNVKYLLIKPLWNPTIVFCRIVGPLGGHSPSSVFVHNVCS